MIWGSLTFVIWHWVMAPLFAYCCIIGWPASGVCMHIKMMCDSRACCWSTGAGELHLYVLCMSQEPSAVNRRSSASTSTFDAGEPSFHREQAGPGGEALGIQRLHFSWRWRPLVVSRLGGSFKWRCVRSAQWEFQKLRRPRPLRVVRTGALL